MAVIIEKEWRIFTSYEMIDFKRAKTAPNPQAPLFIFEVLVESDVRSNLPQHHIYKFITESHRLPQTGSSRYSHMGISKLFYPPLFHRRKDWWKKISSLCVDKYSSSKA